MYLNSLSGIYITPTRFILQYFSVRTKDFSSEIWYNVYELHGTVYKNYCIKCHKAYSGDYVFQSKGIPVCECGGIIKPQVVLYGEALPENEFQKSVELVEHADMLLVLGTSLTVYPACNMVNYFHGKYLVIINRDKTPFDKKADLVIHADLKDVFDALK
ncbi:TPA: hypothetical protein IAB95_01775 [Candidatus Ventrenecus avicola]|nr:hypothetical protein [Candidatus Ventrenecus avicola]